MRNAPASTREKRIKFIQSFGHRAFRTAVMEALHRIGEEHFLTDEQLAEITEQQVQDARLWSRQTVRNRRVSR